MKINIISLQQTKLKMSTTIIGSRTFLDRGYVLSCLEEYYTSRELPSHLVSGGAIGVDRYGEEFAVKNNISLTVITPDYKRFGRPAPLIRDRQMVDMCNTVIAFPNNDSIGTFYTIAYAYKTKKSVVIFHTPETVDNIESKLQSAKIKYTKNEHTISL